MKSLENDSEQARLDESLIQNYQFFYNTVHSYIGNYPLWKVQQEFRQLVLSLEPNKAFTDNEYHFHNIDNYLSKIIQVMADLKSIRARPDDFSHWDTKEMLSEAKGDYLLQEIKRKHPGFKNYEN